MTTLNNLDATNGQGPGDQPATGSPAPDGALAADLELFRHAFTHPSVSSSGPTLRQVLRTRVAVIFSLGSLIWATVLVMGLSGFDPLYTPSLVGSRCLIVLGVVVAAWIAGAVALWARRDWSVASLRAFEFAALVPHAALLMTFRVIHFHAMEDGSLEHGVNFLLASRTHNGFGWMAALVIWGLVFPHPWRRMILINTAIAICPLATDVVLALTSPARAAPLALPGVVTVQMLLFGYVVSLFGSHQIAVLQDEVAEAKAKAREAQEVGPYTLKRVLGIGGMGEVYLAEHRLLKRPCAVKLIRADRAGDPQALSRFEREARATARLKHPNTVDVFDYGRTEDGTFYYVMELLDGMSLDQVVRKHGPLPPGRVVHILRQLCGALREAHLAGLIHRDIKPGNILLCRDAGMFDVVKLVDFGLVSFSEAAGPAPSNLTQVGAVTGTPDYISPEQADGTGADARSDLYSLGATAYFLLAGRPPFTGKTVLDILFAHRTEPVPPLAVPGLSPQLEAVVTRLLSKSPAERYRSADELSIALYRCSLLHPWTDLDSQRWWIANGDSELHQEIERMSGEFAVRASRG